MKRIFDFAPTSPPLSVTKLVAATSLNHQVADGLIDLAGELLELRGVRGVQGPVCGRSS